MRCEWALVVVLFSLKPSIKHVITEQLERSYIRSAENEAVYSSIEAPTTATSTAHITPHHHLFIAGIRLNLLETEGSVEGNGGADP